MFIAAGLVGSCGYAWGHGTGPVARAYVRVTHSHPCPEDAGLFWDGRTDDFDHCVTLDDIGLQGGRTEHARLWRMIAGPLRARTAEAVWQVCRNVRLAKRLTVARYFRHVRQACDA